MKKDNQSSPCPAKKAFALISGKWAMIILYYLSTPARFGELKKRIPEISEKMLIQTLKTLVENNLVNRKDYKTIPPKVEYSLTKKGNRALDIVPILEEIV